MPRRGMLLLLVIPIASPTTFASLSRPMRLDCPASGKWLLAGRTILDADQHRPAKRACLGQRDVGEGEGATVGSSRKEEAGDAAEEQSMMDTPSRAQSRYLHVHDGHAVHQNAVWMGRIRGLTRYASRGESALAFRRPVSDTEAPDPA